MSENTLEVLKTDSGIIAVALQIYAELVLSEDGPQELVDRALALAAEYRDKIDA